jgi:RNA-directed DNA polymerase
MTPAYTALCTWDNLLLAWRKAARGKRGLNAAATFEHGLADRLLALQTELRAQTYRPGPYVNFFVHEPKQRKISAAPFRDRVVHHALCNVLEPRFERLFIADSYANRRGKGTHRAVARVQDFAQRHRYALRCDIVQHFAAIDHLILRETLARVTPEADVMGLIDTILASGAGVLHEQYGMVWFPGDDLLAACRPRGLPIGNLTSQFWSNCYLHAVDQFVSRELRCAAYVRYVDDFVLFGDSKAELWACKRALIDRLARLRLTIHESAAQVVPVECGIPWLGFVVYPTHRLVKSRKVVQASRRLTSRLAEYQNGDISRTDFDASVKGWVNHVRYADTWGLRRHVLGRLPLPPTVKK